MRWFKGFFGGVWRGVLGTLFAVGVIKLLSKEHPDKSGPIILLVVASLGMLAHQALIRTRRH